jgi:hypothetical protein
MVRAVGPVQCGLCIGRAVVHPHPTSVGEGPRIIEASSHDRQSWVTPVPSGSAAIGGALSECVLAGPCGASSASGPCCGPPPSDRSVGEGPRANEALRRHPMTDSHTVMGDAQSIGLRRHRRSPERVRASGPVRCGRAGSASGPCSDTPSSNRKVGEGPHVPPSGHPITVSHGHMGTLLLWAPPGR